MNNNEELDSLIEQRRALREKAKTVVGSDLNDIHRQISAITDAIANITLRIGA